MCVCACVCGDTGKRLSVVIHEASTQIGASILFLGETATAATKWKEFGLRRKLYRRVKRAIVTEPRRHQYVRAELAEGSFVLLSSLGIVQDESVAHADVHALCSPNSHQRAPQACEPNHPPPPDLLPLAARTPVSVIEPTVLRQRGRGHMTRSRSNRHPGAGPSEVDSPRKCFIKKVILPGAVETNPNPD